MGAGDLRPRYRETGLVGAIRTFVRRVADLTHAYRILPGIVELADGSVWVRVSDGYGVAPTRCVLPEENEFLAEEDSFALRSEVALEMMDPDVHGFMLFLLKREEDGSTDLAFRTQTLSQWLPVFVAGFASVLEGVEATTRPLS